MARNERDIEMREDYGFGLPVPSLRYATASLGDWRIRSHPGGLAPAYVSVDVVDPRHHVLDLRDDTWMSTGHLETESHAWHLHRARGTVVVGGLGMAMFAHAVACKPEVERVIVAEIDPDLVAILDASAPEWRHPKIELAIADVRAERFTQDILDRLGRISPDYLYLDIWKGYPDPEAPTLTADLARSLGAREAGWWGQEAELGLRLDGNPADVPTLSAIFQDIGVPAFVDEGYARFCADVTLAHGLVPTRPSI